MKKLLSAITLAAAGMAAQTPAQAALEDWIDDQSIVFHEVEAQSCTKPVNGQASTMTLTVEVLALKESWDKAMAGKTPAQQKALQEKMLALTRAGLTQEFAPRMADFTQKDIEDAYDLDRAAFGADPYRAAISNSFTKISDDVKAATGIETMMGVDAYPAFKAGCTPKP